MNLDNLNFTELTEKEMLEIEGGRRVPTWGDVKKLGAAILAAVESIDVVERFMNGWNSYECN